MFRQISDTVRIEQGVQRVVVNALPEEMLPFGSRYYVGFPDALGKTIEAGKPATLLAYHLPRVWYVYRMDADGRYQPVGGFHEDEAGAQAAAAALME